MNLEADPDAVADRPPAACPFCGHDGVFDAQGELPDTITTTRAGVETVFEATWSQMRCPDCNGTFQMLTAAEEADAVDVEHRPYVGHEYINS